MEYIQQMKDVALSSDAFFPFRDNIDCAHQVGDGYYIKYYGLFSLVLNMLQVRVVRLMTTM